LARGASGIVSDSGGRVVKQLNQYESTLVIIRTKSDDKNIFKPYGLREKIIVNIEIQ